MIHAKRVFLFTILSHFTVGYSWKRSSARSTATGASEYENVREITMIFLFLLANCFTKRKDILSFSLQISVTRNDITGDQIKGTRPFQEQKVYNVLVLTCTVKRN